jgi:hypothetical protein
VLHGRLLILADSATFATLTLWDVGRWVQLQSIQVSATADGWIVGISCKDVYLRAAMEWGITQHVHPPAPTYRLPPTSSFRALVPCGSAAARATRRSFTRAKRVPSAEESQCAFMRGCTFGIRRYILARYPAGDQLRRWREGARRRDGSRGAYAGYDR